MHAIAIWVKKNINCGSKLPDVVHRPGKKGGKDRRSRLIVPKENSIEFVCQMEENRQNHPQNWYFELNIGDPSRNIVEMIFRAALTYPSRHCRKIIKVLRVNNSIEMVERFENHREMVKKRAREQQKGHMRSSVDGNESLQFYGTTMNCCSGKSTEVCETCEDPTCRVCRIIQSAFNTPYMKSNGIQMSTSSEELSEDIIKGKNVKRAVIVCRTIAGTVSNLVDERSHEEYDSIKIEGAYSNSEYLIVQNPSSVLPCFVVVFV